MQKNRICNLHIRNFSTVLIYTQKLYELYYVSGHNIFKLIILLFYFYRIFLWYENMI